VEVVAEVEMMMRRKAFVSAYAAQLRQELAARNAAYATSRGFPHVSSYGSVPVVVYEPCANGEKHGNFLEASYRAILRNPEWKHRLDKIHANAARSMPRSDRRWRELDSCMSSDALLMNVLCHPQTLKNNALCSVLGSQPGESPDFGFRARVPLANGRADRTEVDMKLGDLLVESKLTESDFQRAAAETVESYRDFHDVFDCRRLPKVRGEFASYQLVRNVLAAQALGLSFCVFLDARRPDLIEAWYAIMRCVQDSELRTRCQVLTWQELSEVLPREVRHFLNEKYGIATIGTIAKPTH
jgi:Restriction Endonuclease associating with ARP